ncbi:DNA replication licensing factor MCM3 [Diplonema papillatum]|nr:DNA replication licensing factor MCM3 [Diplonema papillatum]
MATVQLSETQQAVKQQCRDFFKMDDEGRKKYSRLVDEMINAKRTRLVIDIQDLHGFGGTEGEVGSDLGHQLLLSPGEVTRFLDESLREVVENRDYIKVNVEPSVLRVGFEGFFGKFQVSPRELGAWHLNKLVALEGVVTRTTSNVAKIVKSIHWNEAKNSFVERNYRDQLNPELDDKTLPTVNVMPKRDIDNNILRTEHGLCTYHDMQNLVLQERPEKAPVGSLPRSVEVRVEGDLVDSCKPGDRVRIVGVYMPYTEGNREFKTILVASNVCHMNEKDSDENEPLPEELKAIRRMAKKEDIFDQLSAAVAPSIFGHEQAKKAIILMMLGGVEHNIGDHHHIRGDIHLLLVGEPATAKSQLLRFVLKLAPLALSTTGKGSTGVGLTGAVVTDPETGEKSLAAGAMVLADRGVLCIDEFDKMGDNDRVAMHEAMEQGSVTIAKAGIHATLNGRCSVLAAANPVYGFYAVTHSVAFNIGLPESLLSRFDLLFIILDDRSSQWTRLVADHVLQNHRTGQGVTIACEADGDSAMNQAPSSSTGTRKAISVYLPHNPYEKKGQKGRKLISIDFLRLFLTYCKKLKPKLTEQAREKIEEHWLLLRREQAAQELESNSAIYINPRTLECLIRLATAHAKCRLSQLVEEKDVNVAIGLLRNTVNARAEAMESRKREQTVNLEVAAQDGGTAEEGEQTDQPVEGSPKRRKVDEGQPQAQAPAAREIRDIDALRSILTMFLAEVPGTISLSDLRTALNQKRPQHLSELSNADFEQLVDEQVNMDRVVKDGELLHIV